uniref:Acyltransferase ACT3 n=1 Tax=Plectranthus barbatus TaxID=41228 RepID=A0A1B0VRR0_9LAMI|nr:acyltransferase ACT3 [Plectranthus barbatus]
MEGKGVVVEIICKQTVKPSSPTPPHRSNLMLSHLDQLAPPLYFPLIFFFQSKSNSNHIQISQHLKHSLSHALLSFYPLAGTLIQHDMNSYVHCNDAGVEFVDARAHARVSDIQDQDCLSSLKQFLPLDPTAAGERPFLLFQLTFFDCGGVALGVCFSHKVADCVSVMALLHAWAAACRQPQKQINLGDVSFEFDLHTYFPPRVSVVPRPPRVASAEKLVTRRFVFDKHKLMSLKESVSRVLSPTRVELVSGFIWQSFLKGGGEDIIQAAIQWVNLRPRFNPPGVNLDNTMGNGIMFTYALADGDGDGDGVEYEELLRRLRCSINKIDHDYITAARDGDEYGNDHARFFCKGKGGVDWEACSFSSWTRFPLYDVDFGWGNPVWCCTTALPVKNLTILISTSGGDGIEAWVNMNQHNLEILQTQFQLIPTSNS